MRIGGLSERNVEASLIQQLRTGTSASRADLARRLEIAPSTIGQYVDRLIGDGFVQEGQKAAQPSGRWPTVLELNPRAGQFVGVDFEARQLMATAVDFAQKPLREFRTTLSASDSVDDVVRKIGDAVLHVAQGGGPLLGVGVAVPGVVDAAGGIAVHYEYLRGWSNVPLGPHLERRLKSPVFLENNIRAMALAEQLFGHGIGIDHFVCIGIRSGIGAGVVMNGSLYRGSKNVAGEIGHWPCGHGRTLEDVASLKSIGEQLVDAVRGGEQSAVAIKRNRIHPDDLVAAAQAGDELVCDTLWQAGQSVGQVVAQMNLLLNPRKVILAGPLAALEQNFVQSVRDAVEPFSRPPHASSPLIVGSQLGDFGGALGGAALVAQRWEPSRNTVHRGAGARA